jgi:predicted urease superfamily metal-dependent hydrolase
MKITETKQVCVEMVNSLFAVKDIKGKDFAVTVSKNLDSLLGVLKNIEDAGRPSKEFMELAMSVNAFTDDPNDESKIFEIEKLEKENKELIDERRAQLDNVAELMLEEVEITIYPITVEMLPEDITSQQVSSLTKFMK